jgi:hypothetical protein
MSLECPKYKGGNELLTKCVLNVATNIEDICILHCRNIVRLITTTRFLDEEIRLKGL